MSIRTCTDKEPINVYQDSGETTRFSREVWRSSVAVPAPHMGEEYSELTIESRPEGGGVNGPTSADYALTVSNRKKNIGTGFALTGELDGINIVVANDGAASSDAGGTLTNVANLSDGFTVCHEGVSSAYDITKSYIVRQTRFHLGVTDRKHNHSFGLNVMQNIGQDGDAYRCDTSPGQWWTNFLLCYNNGVQKYSVDGNGVTRGAAFCCSGAPVSNPTGISFGGVWSYTATAGTVTPPSKVEGYISVNIGGTPYKIPYYRA